MVWLQETTTAGHGLYFEIRSLERKLRSGSPVAIVTATLGDGSYEGDVLVEFGLSTDVCFVDQWLAPEALRGFLGQINLHRLKDEIVAVCEDGVQPQRTIQPHGTAPRRLEIPQGVVSASESIQ
ncbi:MAG: hypothetical protein C0616_09885 [Desulfuromonas sp.]|nr:MAG: hypothetical protein C0616_09885 [Desulfuromonas sp.]